MNKLTESSSKSKVKMKLSQVKGLIGSGTNRKESNSQRSMDMREREYGVM